MIRILLVLLASWLTVLSPVQAQEASLQDVLQTHQEEIASPSRRSVGEVLEALVATAHPDLPRFLERWQAREVWVRDADGLFFFVEEGADAITLIDITSLEVVGTAAKAEMTELRPNGGVRRVIGSALVQFQLSDPDIERRIAAVDAIARAMSADQLPALLSAIDNEPDAALKTRKSRLAGMLAASFAETEEARIAAIAGLGSDLSVDVRAVLNQILSTTEGVAAEMPDDANIARVQMPGTDITYTDAYDRLVAANLAPARISNADILAALTEHVAGGMVGGIPTAQLNTLETRRIAYTALAADGLVPPLVTDAERTAMVDAHSFFLAYDEDSSAITDAARASLDTIEQKVALSQAADLTLDALSLASIYFLAAIGLAITFGVMGVINMAHGEFIMMGAYTGYVVQLFVPDYTLSILIALPLAFAITFGAGVAMERTVIRWLYHRPLETLLATFGISIALQQLAKNIFGTQARPLTSPEWLDGALVFNDVIAISYIRIAIFVLALVFLALILFVLKRTRLGLEVRAVTQNPGMAASMGINPDRINMLTFGLGSGIAGIAGVAIGLYAKVTSEMGSDYIVQSFMTVVVGGVGNVWGTLAGASMIGFLQKGIEWMNPSNTLAAQTFMILFIILFIQFRPKGIVALKGRAAGD
ncbi:urea transport system permease protein [Rubricella aquisinus]|uniref:Urea transport system permease protein n=1 Tax=Rubricella aquisinus TaxID=2028108 RepID=A0A840WR77_9RHOB|nr:urea ABC transporter permease subunit UrtB [Rubricella aquisinus]MBB5516172.1 urea transport system permease protein [Rubricella aquisinus]